jgi:hypothetical protein
MFMFCLVQSGSTLGPNTRRVEENEGWSSPVGVMWQRARGGPTADRDASTEVVCGGQRRE